ncbi:hypothetical protein PAXRUDRAFT_238394 [Paxillus rubicundulus Ve08.2h10]|uniref:Uncharacterized protein n=1 Tax=Paxillus rubicundulus Ve08.2h10 TaxID=930991 RepID=A0A0D0DGY1_9AGAM|nr:hypothetical protein PAXRUDRAFT_238394 [Paxillus rubicundulus Ve08.2h10]
MSSDMTSFCRPISRVLLDIAPRRVASVPFSRSAVLSAATLSAEQSDELYIPKIFDIFDAPVRLGESSENLRSSEALFRASTSRVASQINSSGPRNLYAEALHSSCTLPPPVTFDGPARPPHLSPSALDKRRLQRQNLVKTSSGASVSFTSLTSRSEPLYEIFDGPSRASRYRYSSSSNEGSRYTYACLALCISSAFGWLASKDMLDSHRHSDVGFA